MSTGMIGKELGNYVVRSLLGEGGMGAVFRGEHRFLGTTVAIKVLHGTFANNPTVTQRFFQEAKSSIEIGHPAIIKILDFGQSAEGELYLVMELLDGQSLAGAIKQAGTFGEGATARIASAICDGLAAAHGKGIVHRDLKPDNLFLTANGEVKILDFGIAKIANSGAGTKSGSLIGTPLYMAPEQAKGAKHVGPHTDIYAMGAIIFEMMAGRPPFTGEDVAELLAKHLFEPPPTPSSLDVPISPEMEQLILQCLSKKPEERPASMAELRDRLALRIGSSPKSGARPIRSVHASSPGATPQTTMSGAASQVGEPPASDAPRSGSRAPMAIAAAVVVLAGGGLLAWKLVGGSSPALPPVAAAPAPKPVEPRPTIAEAPKPPTPVPPKAPEPAKVVLRSEPAGAAVTIDGKPFGTTPALLSIVLPQEVSLTLPGYKGAHEVVTHDGETVVHLSADKKAAPHAPHHGTLPGPPTPTPTPKPRGEGLD